MLTNYRGKATGLQNMLGKYYYTLVSLLSRIPKHLKLIQCRIKTFIECRKEYRGNIYTRGNIKLKSGLRIVKKYLQHYRSHVVIL